MFPSRNDGRLRVADGSFFRSQVAAEPRRSFDFTNFFTNVVARQEDVWTEAEAFLCVILAAASCDGNISPEESEQILGTLHRSRLFKDASGDELRRINSAVADRIARRGARALAEACSVLPEQLALPAFAQAVDVVLADGGFVRSEAEFLDGLMGLLRVSDADAMRIAEVLNIKNGC